MGSKLKETRQLQHDRIAEQIEKRKSLLAERGLDAKEIGKDALLKNLQGDLRRAKAAIKSIEKLAKTVSAARDQKTANAEKRAASRPRRKKSQNKADAPKADGGKKKKKEKKQ